MESVILKKLSIGRAKVGTLTSLHVILSERCTILNISADHSTATLENAKEHIFNKCAHAYRRKHVRPGGRTQANEFLSHVNVCSAQPSWLFGIFHVLCRVYATDGYLVM